MPVTRRPKYTISQAKNFMGRTVREILDPSPSNGELRAMWAHFKGQCCYCGKELDEEGRDWHLDHATADGGNHAGNRVPACGVCNGDEKREQDWRAFLEKKATGSALITRRATVDSWIQANQRSATVHSIEVQNAKQALDELIEQFALKCAELRAVSAGSSSRRGRSVRVPSGRG